MPWYEFKGQKIEAQTPEAAKALITNRLEGNEQTAVTGESFGSNMLAGIGSGLMNVGRQAGNVLGLVDDETIQQQGQTDEALLGTGAGQVGRLVGEVAGTLPFGMGAGSAARAGLTALKGAQTTARVLPAAVEAAAEGGLLAGPDNRGTGALMGGGIGGGLGMATKIAGRAFRPNASTTPGARVLQDEGINLMPGYANRGGALKALEESSAGRLMPGVAEAKQGNVDDVVRLMMQRAAPSKAAREAITLNRGGELAADLDGLYKSFDPLYSEVKGYPSKMITSTGQGLDAAMLGAAASAPADDMVRQRVGRFIEQELSGLQNKTGGRIKSDDLLEMRSRIRDRIRARQRVQGDPDEIDALDSIEDILSDAIEAHLPTTAKGILRRADKQYAKYKTVEDVVASRGSMPMNRNSIVKGIERAEQRIGSRGAMARGSDKTGFRDLSNAAAEALDETTTKTGMGLLIPGVVSGLGGAAGSSIGMPGIGAAAGALAGGLAPALAATSPRLRAAMTGTTGWQRGLAQTMDRIRDPIRYGGALTRAAGVQQGNEFIDN